MPRVSDLVARVLASAGGQSVLTWTDRSPWPSGRFAALTYHRIDDPSDHDRLPGLVSATPGEFEAQVEVLARHYDLIDLDQLLAAARCEASLPDRAVLLTFDDATDDFARHALPVLERIGAPAVVFVPTGFVDRPDRGFWWDAVHCAVTTTRHRGSWRSPVGDLPLGTADERSTAVRTLLDHLKRVPFGDVEPAVAALCADLDVEPPPADVMSWETLRTVARSGVSVCPHTRHHPHLDRIPVDLARREIAESWDDLRRELGEVPPVFAYPAGQMNERVVSVVSDLGFEAAFTTRRGTNRIGASDALTLRRINVSRRTGLGATRLQMHPLAGRADRRRVAVS